ncbi:MAG: fumarate hydratase C-terminal domain-containing protein, partial [Chloroflexota bacterium]
MRRLTIPIGDEDIRSLHIGDTVFLNGIIVLGRDAAHKFMVENFIRNPVSPDQEKLYGELKRLLNGGVIYHCGPVVSKDEDDNWIFVA